MRFHIMRGFGDLRRFNLKFPPSELHPNDEHEHLLPQPPEHGLYLCPDDRKSKLQLLAANIDQICEPLPSPDGHNIQGENERQKAMPRVS